MNDETRATMTVEAASQALDVHVNTVRNWIRAGFLEARELPSGFHRPYVDSVLHHVAGQPSPSQIKEAMRELSTIAEKHERAAAGLRSAIETLRSTFDELDRMEDPQP